MSDDYSFLHKIKRANFEKNKKNTPNQPTIINLVISGDITYN